MEHQSHTAVESLAGKRVLVTGGTTGISREIAILLGSYGACIITFGRHKEPLQETLTNIREAGGKADSLVADSSKPEDIQRVFQFADDNWDGQLDILINCAALGGGALAEMSDEDWRYVISTNLKKNVKSNKPRRCSGPKTLPYVCITS